MKKNAQSRTTRVTPEQADRDRAIRAKYLTTKPSLSTLRDGGQVAEPILQGEYFTIMQLMSRLKEIRKQKNLSLADVNQKSGLDRAAISRLENGQVANPTFSTVNTLARALGVRVRLSVEDVDAATNTSK